MHLPEEQKTKISVHAETYCIVSAYVYTPASWPIYKLLLTGKASTTVGSFIAMYLAVVCAFEPVPFRKIM